jgi:uncharacterized Zn-binding protein involved in type VI secretion|tara:strand:+ start:15529 stop:15897 length:369 start_codon:yes stop_codon:yes gene_type:complete
MPAITRVGDADVSHCSGMVREGHVKTVFCNGIEVSCEGHNNTGHLFPAPPICLNHQAPIAKGSPNVFAEGIPVGRIGDPIAGCTSVAEGSPNVFANGGSGSKDNTSESLVPDDGSNFGEGGA